MAPPPLSLCTTRIPLPSATFKLGSIHFWSSVHSIQDINHRIITSWNIGFQAVVNFAIDLPDANVAIQVSGTFGSRQEEAQRLGRILRPKSDGGMAYFYSIVTRDTRDQEFSANRQLFLTEQGYRYLIEDAEELLAIKQQ